MSVHHILVVDDDEAIREVAQMSLEMVGGWEVSTASGGQEALVMAAARCPDAILLDVMMPGMDGPTALARLRAQELTRMIPVVFLTAKVQSSERQRWAAQDVAGVLTKPFDPMNLADQVAACLAWTD
ncbi:MULTISPECIES: response regulator [unclassified Frankia]|uniref:response regulator n=1 Tax=unclassified Frankia TaxID=2632575 RepID=UPI001EF60727|nr:MULTISPECIES: response regulator [unclassified Frankia]